MQDTSYTIQDTGYKMQGTTEIRILNLAY